MTACQRNGKTSSICPSGQKSAHFLIKESTFSYSLQLDCGTLCHRMLRQAKNSARCKKKNDLNANANSIFFFQQTFNSYFSFESSLQLLRIRMRQRLIILSPATMVFLVSSPGHCQRQNAELSGLGLILYLFISDLSVQSYLWRTWKWNLCLCRLQTVEARSWSNIQRDLSKC